MMTLGPVSNMNDIEYKRQEEAFRQVYLAKFLHAMKEDLAEWISSLTTYNININAENFISSLENGVILCQHARHIQRYAEEYAVLNTDQNVKIPRKEVRYTEKCAYPGSFIARDNVANFIYWCRELGIPQVVMFETEDLVSNKNEKSVILTLLDVARKAYQFGVEPPEIVKFEEEIDAEIERDKENERLGKPEPKPFDLEAHNNLDEMVRNIVNRCSCYDRFPIKKLSEGKYKLGRNNVVIFVRIMRKNVMVRVGGGWDTFEHFITKHDPCRTKIAGTIQNNNVVVTPNQKRKEQATPSKKSPLSKSNSKSGRPSSGNWSMCSGSTGSSGSIDTISKSDCRCSGNQKGNPNNSRFIDDSNSDGSDMSVSFTKSIEELDQKLQQIQNSNIDLSIRDATIYDNKADRWLRNQMNSFKQRNSISNDENVHPSDDFVMRRGYTLDVIERNKNNKNHQDQGTLKNRRMSSQCRSRSQTSPFNVLQPCDNKVLPRGYTMQRELTAENMAVKRRPDSSQSLSSVNSEPTTRSCCDMSTQTDFEIDFKISNTQRRSSIKQNDITQSRIPRPTLQRSRTSDGISTSRIRKRNLEKQALTRLNREISDLKASPRSALRRQKSDMSGVRIRKKQEINNRVPCKRR